MSSLSTANRQGISADCFDVTSKQADETTHMFAWTWMTSKQMTHLTCLLWHDWQASWWRTSLIASKQPGQSCQRALNWLTWVDLFVCANQVAFKSTVLNLFSFLAAKSTRALSVGAAFHSHCTSHHGMATYLVQSMCPDSCLHTLCAYAQTFVTWWCHKNLRICIEFV